MRLGGVWHFDLCICLSFKAHSQTARSMDSPMNFKLNIAFQKEIHFNLEREQEREEDGVWRRESERVSACQTQILLYLL